MAEIPRQGERFQEHFGNNDRGAQVEKHPALQLGNHRGQQVKIAQAALPDGPPVHAGVHMDNVGPDCDMYAGRHLQPGTGGQHAQRGVGQLFGKNTVSHGPANPDPLPYHPGLHGGVQKLPGFLRHAEPTGIQAGGHILGGRALIGQLKVVDNTGPVERNRGNNAALQEIDNQWRQADLERVSAHAQDNRPPGPDRGGNAAGDLCQVGSGQYAGQGVQKLSQAAAHPPRPAQALGGNLAAALTERIGGGLPRVNGGEFHGVLPRPGPIEAAVHHLADHVANENMGFLNPGRDGCGRDTQAMIDQGSHRPAVPARQPDGRYADGATALKAAQHVCRVAAGRERDGDIMVFAERLDLLGKNIGRTVVVGD